MNADPGQHGGRAGPAGPDVRAEPAEPSGPAARRPLIERLGLTLVALVIAVLFGGMAVAAWIGGEGFLAVMAGIGALMTAWAGALTLLRG